MDTRSRWARRLAAGAPLALAPVSLALAAGISWNNDPASPGGPEAWGRLQPRYATCGAVFAEGGAFEEVGLRQSPIDIDTAAAVRRRFPALQFRYRPLRGEVENNGHVVEVPYANGSTLRIGEGEYELLQFHFHARSEHTFDGQAAPLEVHLVHRNVFGDLAVVGVRMEVGPDPNPLVEAVLERAPLDVGHEELHERINARDLLPRRTDAFYVYSGSLTTPPCSEGVRWIVMKQAVRVSARAVEAMEAVNAHNNGTGHPFNHRPVRPVNGRAVIEAVGREVDDD